MGYPSRESGLGLSIRQAFPTQSVQVMGPTPGVSSMRPGGFFYSAPPVAGGRTGPTNDEVLASLYGSAEKGRAAQAASIAEAQQRQRELMDKAAQTPAYTPPTPAIETSPPVIYEPEASAIEPVPEDEYETEGDVIEEVAEGEDEGDSEFSGWGCGMGERPVGVSLTRREGERMGDVRRRQKKLSRREFMQRQREKVQRMAPRPRADAEHIRKMERIARIGRPPVPFVF